MSSTAINHPTKNDKIVRRCLQWTWMFCYCIRAYPSQEVCTANTGLININCIYLCFYKLKKSQDAFKSEVTQSCWYTPNGTAAALLWKPTRFHNFVWEGCGCSCTYGKGRVYSYVIRDGSWGTAEKLELRKKRSLLPTLRIKGGEKRKGCSNVPRWLGSLSDALRHVQRCQHLFKDGPFHVGAS